MSEVWTVSEYDNDHGADRGEVVSCWASEDGALADAKRMKAAKDAVYDVWREWFRSIFATLGLAPPRDMPLRYQLHDVRSRRAHWESKVPPEPPYESPYWTYVIEGPFTLDAPKEDE